MRIKLALVVPCLVTCAAGVLSCGGQAANPASGGPDAGRDGGGYDASGAPDSKMQFPDASVLDLSGIEAWGTETALPIDVAADQSVGGDSAVVTIEADAAILDSAAATPGPEGGPNLRVDAGGDFGARDASVPEAVQASDAPSLEASVPDAKADAPTADEMVMPMDATTDRSTPDAVAMCGRINCDCTYKGKKLWGNVEIVTSFPDFTVKVSSFPDLNVKETSFPMGCGEWHTVTAFGDFKVQIVTAFEDFDIAYSSFPGMP